MDDGRFWIGAGAVALAALVVARRGSSSRARTVPIGEAGWTFPVSKRIAERFEVLSHQIKVWEHAASITARSKRGSTLRRVAPAPEPVPEEWKAWRSDPRIPPPLDDPRWINKSPSGTVRRLEWRTPVNRDLPLCTQSNAADSTTPLVWVIVWVPSRGFTVSFERAEAGMRFPLQVVVHLGRDGRRIANQRFLKGLTWEEAGQVTQWAALRLIGPSLTRSRWTVRGSTGGVHHSEFRTPLSTFRLGETRSGEVELADELYRITRTAGKKSMYYRDFIAAATDAVLRYDKAIDAIVRQERKKP